MAINRFKLARLERGFRQLDIARAVGLGETQVSRIETGRMKPARELVERIARALDVTPEYLTGGPSDE